VYRPAGSSSWTKKDMWQPTAIESRPRDHPTKSMLTRNREKAEFVELLNSENSAWELIKLVLRHGEFRISCFILIQVKS
jgi:hypothetical protein